MTRETKIGLLVGLAFIIVIGILLSDHLASSTEPPQAPLSTSGNNARAATAVPGALQTAPVTPVVTPPAVAPVTPVPTPEELRKPVEIVAINPPTANSPITIKTPAAVGAASSSLTPIPPMAHGSNDQAPDIEAGPGKPEVGLAPLAALTHSQSEELVKAREYRAQSGDTLSKMAARLMGGNTKANRDAIVRANKSLQANPAKIVVGHPYMIPVVEKEAKATPAHSSPTASLLAAAPTTAPSETLAAQPTAPATAENIYVVKSGDTLWKIAATQLGNRNAVAAIKELNKDVLKGGDKLHLNMKLRLPSKPLASAR